MSFKKISLTALLGFMAGCSGGSDLSQLAQQARGDVVAQAPVVVFLPGTLASSLVNSETGDRVWGRHETLSLDPRGATGLRQLSLPLTPTTSGEAAAMDAIRPLDALDRAGRTILGMRVSIPIYEDAMAALVEAGLPETAPMQVPASGPSLTPFPYDWRRSIVDGAQALGATLEARGEGAEPVTLVGHSMGGAVALHYLMYGTAPLDAEGALPQVTWAGAQHVRRAILIAPPLRGAAVALRNTINGNKLAGPLVPTYPTTMLATHPSSFELMPDIESGGMQDADGTIRADGGLDADLWQRQGWGLANPTEAEQRRWLAGAGDDPDARGLSRQAALIARGRAFHRLGNRAITPPERVSLHVIAGTGADTPSAVRIIGDHAVEVAAEQDGDGTVTLASAISRFDGTEIPVSVIEAGHARMLSDPTAFAIILDEISAP